MTTWKLTTSSD